MAPKGKVYLLGAGPGAVDLITVRGARILAQADVIIYDSLSNEDLLGLAPPPAERIYAGKRGGAGRALEQEQINRLLIEKSRTAAVVVRLKGGDPFIFGRGGEEAMALAEAGVSFEVVPGITSAIAVPAFAGIPLTHRGFGSFVAIATGQVGAGKDPDGAVPWADLARAAGGQGTLVLLMATARLAGLTNRLIAAGMAPDTPAAAIQDGTLATQHTVCAPLARLAEEASRAGIGSPAVIVIGQVAGLRGKLAWREQQPLFARRIVVTRSRATAGALVARLRDLGAEVLELPTIETRRPDSYADLDGAIARLSEFDWVIFTSANGVERFVDRLRELGGDVRRLSGARLAAIGPATARRLLDFGLRAAAVPAEYRAEAIIGAIGEQKLSGARILIPRAQVAREALIELLRERGAAEVLVAAAYKTVCPRPPEARRVRALMRRRGIDLVTFTSSSTVNNFCEIMGEQIAHGQAAAVIGPITERTARERHFKVVASARAYTVDGLFEAICSYFAGAAEPAK